MINTCNRASDLHKMCPGIKDWSWPTGPLFMHGTELYKGAKTERWVFAPPKNAKQPAYAETML